MGKEKNNMKVVKRKGGRKELWANLLALGNGMRCMCAETLRIAVRELVEEKEFTREQGMKYYIENIAAYGLQKEARPLFAAELEAYETFMGRYEDAGRYEDG